MNYQAMSPIQLKAEHEQIKNIYSVFKEKNLTFDMSRGKPEPRQLSFSLEMLNNLKSDADCKGKDGIDVRNYGAPTGITEIKELFSQVLDVKTSEIAIGGNSSLKLMYNVLVDAMLIGLPESRRPWSKEEKIKFLCPAPGYDRHFSMCEHLGIEMITVPMLQTGPDMDQIEQLVSEDESIKGVWCVPKYSNPTGITFSDETVRRFATLKPKATDFRIFWDNAYMIHDLYESTDPLLNIIEEAKNAGNPNLVFEFFSTSKITFAGGGICVVASSANNIRWLNDCMALEGLGYDKVNQLRHARYIKNPENLHRIMMQHASILRPKFEAVTDTFETCFGDCGIATWHKPNGGYFISLDVFDGTAKRTWQLASELGITLTPVGATFPYRKDPNDRNLRIAPSNVPIEQVSVISEMICVCARLAALEKLIGIDS